MQFRKLTHDELTTDATWERIRAARQATTDQFMAPQPAPWSPLHGGLVSTLTIPYRGRQEHAIVVMGSVLVESSEVPGTWHEVLDSDGYGCSCRGYGYRGVCRHVAIARLARQMQQERLAQRDISLAVVEDQNGR